ncbi:MAG TPA: glucose/galactose MFS transporter [Puia sp.]
MMSLSAALLMEPSDQRQYRKNITIIGVFFFIFGFITWINATLIPYLRIACELKEWEAYLVTFAFYISYTVMAIPSSRLLQRTGMIKGMSIGLAVMGLGCLIFIPAAVTRQYSLFLTGLVFAGGGLTLLQTAVNPYITFLGPENSAAKRISIMGICNKTAGILAPWIMSNIILKDSGGLLDQLKQMNAEEKKARLDALSQTVITPYICLSAILFLIALLIRYAHLPELKTSSGPQTSTGENKPLGKAVRTQYILGFTAIFFAVGCEVMSGDTIGNYGLYHGINLDISKHLASYPLTAMMIGYITGVVCIPKYISRQKAFSFSCRLGLFITPLIVILPGRFSIACVALLGLANAMLWPAIWPQALKGLQGKALAKGSAILIMAIAGGALMPLTYGWLSTIINNQYAYLLLLPAYLYLLYYSGVAKREMNLSQKTSNA